MRSLSARGGTSSLLSNSSSSAAAAASSSSSSLLGGSAIAHGLRSFHRGSAFLPAFVIEGCNAQLDEIGFDFVRKCMKFIEDEGIREQGIYRNCGVNSKVKKMMSIGLEKRKCAEGKSWAEETEWEIKTVSSAFKTYLRNLPEPLMTFDLHSFFISAAKMDDRKERVEQIHYYVYQLPKEHKEMLELVIKHLRKVADRAGDNLMTVGNLGVCFGPTLLRPKEETVAAIMDIKFCNVVVEVLISHAKEIFDSAPPVREKKSEGGEKKDDRIDEEREKRGEENVIGTTRKEEAIIHNDRLKDKQRILPTMSSFEKEDRRQIKRSAHVEGGRPRRHGSNADDSKDRKDDFEEVHRENYPGVCASSNYVNNSTRVPPHQPARHGMHHAPVHPPVLAASTSASSASSSTPRPTLAFTASSTSSCKSGTPSQIAATSSHPPPAATLQQQQQPIYAFLPPPSTSKSPSKPRVRTLYTCTPDHESELSFEAGQIITDVTESKEDGWLIGTLNGKTGLIPANYVEQL